MKEIIPLSFHHFFDVNCYLIETSDGFILIDTALSSRRDELEEELVKAGCTPGKLRLILLTHGHLDHIGNCAYLRDKYGCKVVMHVGDTPMAELGDMFYDRNILLQMVFKLVTSILRLGVTKFKPDILLEDGENLSPYGFDAKVIHLPGHSRGSIGTLTPDGTLFCGDLLDNTEKPSLNKLADNKEEMKASLKKLLDLEIKTVYPGHGEPFTMTQFKANNPLPH
jgi:hydroxyacylglutathione hydrolase